MRARRGRGGRNGRPFGMPVCDPSGLRIATWNVLADSLAQSHSYLYRGCNPAALQLSNRLPRIVEWVRCAKADVLALQEVEDFAADFKGQLAEVGLTGMYKRRTGDGHRDGVALFWRTERLTLVRAEPIEFGRELPAATAPEDSMMADLLRKPNVALVALLFDHVTGRELVVATTHLLWNPKRGLVKLRQLQHLLLRVDAMRRAPLVSAPLDAPPPESLPSPPPHTEHVQPEHASIRPVILLGDLNLTPDSLLYTFLLGSPLSAPLHSEREWDGQQAASSQRKQRRPIPSELAQANVGSEVAHGSQSARAHQAPRVDRSFASTSDATALSAASWRGDGARDALGETHPLAAELASAYGGLGEPECTSFHGGFQGTVDYITYTAAHFRVRSVLPTPQRVELVARRVLPDWLTPSDHVPIACDLTWASARHAANSERRESPWASAPRTSHM